MSKPNGMTCMVRSKLSLRIDLSNGSRLGPGKVSLLEAVRTCSSISGAAREQGMSYRRAWLLIDDMNKAFRQPVVETFPGRSQGKGAAITPFGEQLIALYRAAEKEVTVAVKKQASEIEAAIDPDYSAARVKSRRDRPDADDA